MEPRLFLTSALSVLLLQIGIPLGAQQLALTLLKQMVSGRRFEQESGQ